MMAWLTSAQVLRWGIFIAYSIALFIGVALIFSRRPGLPLTFTAERELPANWLLQPGDLALRPGDHPWYLKHTAKKDQKIGLGDLSTFPIIAERPGKLPVAFSVGNPPPTDEGKAFAIGSHCVTSVPEKSIGPLFVGFNCLARPVNVVRLKIVIAGATIPP
jgi:hypothetical protein